MLLTERKCWFGQLRLKNRLLAQFFPTKRLLFNFYGSRPITIKIQCLPIHSFGQNFIKLQTRKKINNLLKEPFILNHGKYRVTQLIPSFNFNNLLAF